MKSDEVTALTRVDEVGRFGLALATEKSVEEAERDVTRELAERKFGVLWRLDLKATLAEKGIQYGPEFRILEVCSAPRAKEALDADLGAGYFLPCKVTVYEQDGQTRIGLVRPTTLMTFFDNGRLTVLAEEVEEVLSQAMEAAARP